MLPKIAIALSGGIDSMVAGLLLQKQGYKILGLNLLLLKENKELSNKIYNIASQLNIPYKIINAKYEFNQQVILPTIKAYLNGQTPNPCIICNSKIKFPILWKNANQAGCIALATGHYAKLIKINSKTIVIAEGIDRYKNQSYFLAQLNPTILKKIIFPLGNMTKKQTRQLAQQAGLIAIEYKESQDSCFIPFKKWNKITSKNKYIKFGPIINNQKNILGYHNGIHNYTIGQRRGLGLSLGQPIYVLNLDPKSSSVKVGPKSELWMNGLIGINALWYIKKNNKKIQIRLRYGHKRINCQIWINKQRVIVSFLKPQLAVTPGQLAVFYHDNYIIGSAYIYKAINNF